MKITILQGAFLPVPPTQGGAVEKIWFRMGQEFAKLGHDVVHISRSFKGFPSNEEINGVAHIRTSGYDTPKSLLKLKFLDLLYTRKAIRLIPGDSDIIVTNTFWAPLLISSKLKRKVYVSVERVPRGQMKYYKGVLALRGCSPSIEQAIKSELPMDFYPSVTFIPNPVPFEIDPNLLSSRKKHTILFVGRLHPEKGLTTLIKAYSKLSPAFQQKWPLKIIGPYLAKDGGGGNGYYQQLLEEAQDLNIQIVGPVFDDKRLVKEYAEASIFVYPAQDGSGDAAPVAPREAMAYGAVPVVSRLDCFNDFITNGVNGLTFNQSQNDQAIKLSEILSNLINDEELRQNLSQQAKETVKIYSSSTIAQKFVADFNRLRRYDQ